VIEADNTGPDEWRYRATREVIPGANLDGGRAEMPRQEGEVYP
jgi:hypothetical protein